MLYFSAFIFFTPVYQHVILRVLLWLSRNTPLNYARFLDFAVSRILLRRVGGGYIFIRRRLLEYFATQPD